jgi:hypothetical protein
MGLRPEEHGYRSYRKDLTLLYFSEYLHNINSIQAATTESIQTLGAMVILQNRRKLKIHLFNHPLGYTEK